jgi:hypothetical protein
MTEREVVLHRVAGVEGTQRIGDFPGHRPARAGVTREAEAAADPDHMSIERHDER